MASVFCDSCVNVRVIATRELHTAGNTRSHIHTPTHTHMIRSLRDASLTPDCHARARKYFQTQQYVRIWMTGTNQVDVLRFTAWD